VILNKEYFEIAPKLIWRQTASRILATVDTKGVWFGRSILSAILRDEYKEKVDYRYALAIFNSELINSVYQSKVKELGKVFPQVKLTYLRDLPFVIATPQQQAQIAQLVDKIMELKKEMSEITGKTLRTIEREYKPKNLGKKLQEFYKLDFGEFITELEKQKVSLTLSKKEELEEYFEEKKTTILELEKEVERVDAEIEELVRGLYGVMQ